MKRCPKCNKEISEHARQCPYCGHYLSGKYQPIKKSGDRKIGAGYITLALILIVLPMIVSYFISSPAANNKYQPKEMVTLGAVEKINKEEEKVRYVFESLDDFSKLIDCGNKYVEKIEKLEGSIDQTVKKYAKPNIDKTYQIIVTKSNNIFFYLTYDIDVDDNQTMTIDSEYDRTGRINETKINYSVDHFKDFQTMKIHQESYPMYKEIITLINGDKELKTFQEAGNDFNQLENAFNKRNGKIGNYGLGITKESDNDTVSCRVVSKKEEYRLNLKYQTEMKDKLY